MALRSNGLILAAALVCFAAPSWALAEEPLPVDWAPPATPLVVCDPYFSVWSTGRTLNDAETTHWTGRRHRLSSVVVVDGMAQRLMGAAPIKLPALKQVGQSVTPTRSVYRFAGSGIALELTFTTPALPDDIDLLSRPITYIDYEVRATDGAEHEVSVVFAASGELAVNQAGEPVSAGTTPFEGGTALKVGSVSQQVLVRQGDDVRIDWGFLYVAAPQGAGASLLLGRDPEESTALRRGQTEGLSDRPIGSAPAKTVTAGVVFEAESVGAEPVSKWLVLAYDDLYSIEFMGKQLRPYWRRNGWGAEELLEAAVAEHDAIVARCGSFDRELIADLAATGGSEYVDIACLAYRQCFAAGKFVADANGQPIQFSKENHSNGCIATSDVFYPMAPQFLLFGPSLAKSFVVPFMEYASSDRWKFPFAPHDLGTYPQANGQVYGGGERSEENQMPVEESGNLLILMAAIARLDGDAEFAGRYWPQLLEWADYLKQEGFDPGNQLCTDDFAGHMAHNVNLSAKAICGLGAFAQLCEMRGDVALAQEYSATAKQFAQRWVAAADDGNHFRLAFDKPDTWSQKYNLVWDQVLGLGLFPGSVVEKEMRYYRRMQNRYGLPLDNRQPYTKLDWILWTATLTGDQEDFAALVQPVHRFLRETPDKAPMTDWYRTHSGQRVGFTARPVVGGVFMRLLHEPRVWEKWAGRDTTDAGGYAPMPKPPVLEHRVAAADVEPTLWRHTTVRPPDGWELTGFDDSLWDEGESGFGKAKTSNSPVGTVWNGPEIWIRRGFDLPGKIDGSLRLHLHHDEDAEVYFNGVLAGRFTGFSTHYVLAPIRPEAIAALKPSGNVLAVHCRQTTGGQFIDVGIATVKTPDP